MASLAMAKPQGIFQFPESVPDYKLGTDESDPLSEFKLVLNRTKKREYGNEKRYERLKDLNVKFIQAEEIREFVTKGHQHSFQTSARSKPAAVTVENPSLFPVPKDPAVVPPDAVKEPEEMALAVQRFKAVYNEGYNQVSLVSSQRCISTGLYTAM